MTERERERERERETCDNKVMQDERKQKCKKGGDKKERKAKKQRAYRIKRTCQQAIERGLSNINEVSEMNERKEAQSAGKE